MTTKTEKAKVLHLLEACFQPLTPKNKPVGNVIDGNVQLYVLSPIPDNVQSIAEMVSDRLQNYQESCSLGANKRLQKFNDSSKDCFENGNIRLYLHFQNEPI